LPDKTKKKRKTSKEEEKPKGVGILVVACPYEAPRFEDAAKMIEGAGRLEVRDVAELLADAMGL
jgi:hypothetical protein